MAEQGTTLNALSFDIEEWFHLLDLPVGTEVEHWNSLPAIVERYSEKILEILDDAQVRATFFVVGWVAERHPCLCRKLAAGGHEIASHSYWHQRVDRQNRLAFHHDVSRSVNVLEQQLGRKILGFRAPGFSVNHAVEWALDVLLDLGFEYDASLKPATGRAAGFACSRQPHRLNHLPSGRSILELPASVLRIAGLETLYAGGGYLRLIPNWLLQRLIANQNRRGLPVVVYLHPRDFATDCPRVAMPWHRRFRTYVNLHSTERKLRDLLKNFSFDCCGALLGLQPVQPVRALPAGHDFAAPQPRPMAG